MIYLKSMSLSALAVIQSARAFSSNAASVSATRHRYGYLAPRTRCRHTAPRLAKDGDAKQQVTRMEAGASPDSPSPVLGRGREVGRRNVATCYPESSIPHGAYTAVPPPNLSQGLWMMHHMRGILN